MTSPYALERYFTAHCLPLLGAIVCALALAIPPACGEEFHRPDGRQVFQRIATFPVFLNTDEETQTTAEIVSASEDGSLLIYTDSMTGNLGFVDIVDPRDPKARGVLGMSGEPTSVAVAGPYALAAVNTSESFSNPSGELVVVDIESRSIVRRINLGGQPDSVAVSPDGHFAAVAIENERDEDVNGGAMPQSPPGFLTIVDTVGAPSAWTTRDVVLVGFSDRFPTDPEPEFVDINANNQAAVTLQENNHVVIVDLPSGTVVRDWPTGTTSHLADLEDDGQIVFDDRLRDARREPDAIVWTRHNNLLTANEGDYDLDLGPGEFVGGRNFSIFTRAGDIVFDGGVQLERRIAQAGRYDDTRSDDKGCEIEGAEVARYDGRDFAFLGAERCASVAVYRIDDQSAPDFIQILPTGSRPEGLLAIPDRSLFVSANEGDGTISIFQRQQ